MGDSIAERYGSFLGPVANPNPNPPSPARMRFEAAVLPPVDAMSGAIARWRARMRGEDQASPPMPPAGCNCP